MKTNLSDVVDQDFKTKMNVLDKNETRRERIWKECVDEAKKLLKINNETRIKIVELAEKCCVIHHGGKYVTERFTLTRFADEIGMNSKTLYDWVRLKRNVYDNLSDDDKKTVTFKQLGAVDARTRSIPKKTEAYKKAVSDEFKKSLTDNESTQKIREYNKRLTTILFNVKNKALIRHVDRSVLAETLHLTREISKNLSFIDTEIKGSKNAKQ